MSGATKPVRLIATDLDGTLLSSDGTVSDRTRAALRAAIGAGIEVVPATGRPHQWTEDIIGQLRFVDHWVFANGSVTWHQGREEVMRGWWLDADLARSLIRRLRRVVPTVCLAVEYHRSVTYEAGFASLGIGLPTLAPTDDLLDHLGRDIQKLLVLDGDGADAEELHRVVADLVGDEAVTTYSGLSFVEVGARLVTKASALRELANDLGIDRSQVVAFGDYFNDLEMLRWAGRSYAMGHASEDVLAAADEVIGFNDEDAVAAVVEQIVADQT
jgi:Cof subfamily protein (haloacid dehalogenase superfamily)